MSVFRYLAILAREDGYDKLELQMVLGYLLSQFLSPAYNKRSDRYGGDATARATFPAMVLRCVLDSVGDDMAVLCKMSVTDGFKGGATPEDSSQVVRVVEEAGAHMIVLSAGMDTESPWAIFGSPMPKVAVENAVPNRVMKPLAGWFMDMRQPKFDFQPLYLLEYSRRVRQAVNLPLAYLGGVESLDAA